MNDIRLCQVIQGVETTVRVGSRSFRLVVLAEALRERFGADSTPESWLQAFASHATDIQRLACEQFHVSGDPLVIVRRIAP